MGVRDVSGGVTLANLGLAKLAANDSVGTNEPLVQDPKPAREETLSC